MTPTDDGPTAYDLFWAAVEDATPETTRIAPADAYAAFAAAADGDGV